MKILMFAVGFAIMLGCGGAAHALTYCDWVADGYLGNRGRACIPGTYSQDTTYLDLVLLNSPFNYACVSYDNEVVVDSRRFLENCHVTSYGCMAEYYVEAENMAGCTLCPDGSAASSEDGHTNTTCEYCAYNFYYDGTACVACPSGGKADGWAEYRRPITECCWRDATGSDETGTFEYIGGANDCCYVQ